MSISKKVCGIALTVLPGILFWAIPPPNVYRHLCIAVIIFGIVSACFGWVRDHFKNLKAFRIGSKNEKPMILILVGAVGAALFISIWILVPKFEEKSDLDSAIPLRITPKNISPVVTRPSVYMQSGYEIISTTLPDGTILNGLYGIPIRESEKFRSGKDGHLACIKFDLTNLDSVQLRITDVSLKVVRYSTADIVTGIGDMVAGAKYMTYDCLLTSDSQVVKGVLRNKDIDFLITSPGELEPIEIVITADSPGLYWLQPIVEYSLRGKNESLALDAIATPFVFFK